MLVGDTFVKQSQTFFTLNPVSYIFVQWQLWDRAQYICAKISLSGVAPSVMTTCVEQKGCRLSKPDDVKPKFSAFVIIIITVIVNYIVHNWFKVWRNNICLSKASIYFDKDKYLIVQSFNLFLSKESPYIFLSKGLKHFFPKQQYIFVKSIKYYVQIDNVLFSKVSIYFSPKYQYISSIVSIYFVQSINVFCSKV